MNKHRFVLSLTPSLFFILFHLFLLTSLWWEQQQWVHQSIVPFRHVILPSKITGCQALGDWCCWCKKWMASCIFLLHCTWWWIPVLSCPLGWHPCGVCVRQCHNHCALMRWYDDGMMMVVVWWCWWRWWCGIMMVMGWLRWGDDSGGMTMAVGRWWWWWWWWVMMTLMGVGATNGVGGLWWWWWWWWWCDGVTRLAE